MKKKYLIIITLLILLLVSCQTKTKFSGGFAIVYQDNTPYLLNSEGKTLSLAKYDGIGEVFGKYIVVKKYSGQKLKYGYIDHNGKEVIKPTYDMAYPFSEDLAVVVKGGTYYLINPKGKTVYQFKDGIKSYDSFVEGLRNVIWLKDISSLKEKTIDVLLDSIETVKNRLESIDPATFDKTIMDVSKDEGWRIRVNPTWIEYSELYQENVEPFGEGIDLDQKTSEYLTRSL